MSDDQTIPGAGLGGLMQRAMEMQKQVQEAQRRAATRRVTGEAGGGLVRVTVNGHQEVLEVSIDPVVVNAQELEMLQDLVTAATNAAMANAKQLLTDELGPLAQMLQKAGVAP
jgi:DNA-binding YbaB/EbfC family protein